MVVHTNYHEIVLAEIWGNFGLHHNAAIPGIHVSLILWRLKILFKKNQQKHKKGAKPLHLQ